MHDQHEVRYQVPDTLLLIRGSQQAVQGTAGDDFVHACGRENFDTFTHFFLKWSRLPVPVPVPGSLGLLVLVLNGIKSAIYNNYSE
jgi:hypothetical protein